MHASSILTFLSSTVPAPLVEQYWDQIGAKNLHYSLVRTRGAICGVKSGGQILWSGCCGAPGRSLGRGGRGVGGGGSPPIRPCPGRDYREGYRYRRQLPVRWNSYEVLPHAVTCYAGRRIFTISIIAYGLDVVLWEAYISRVNFRGSQFDYRQHLSQPLTLCQARCSRKANSGKFAAIQILTRKLSEDRSP